MTAITIHTVRQRAAHNLSLKLLSLALAFCVWCLSAISQTTETRFTLPVRFSNIPPGYAVKGPIPDVVDITLTGPLYLITAAKQSSKALTLDLGEASKSGTTAFPHLESYLKLSQGITVSRISPASLELRLEAEHSPQGDLHQ